MSIKTSGNEPGYDNWMHWHVVSKFRNNSFTSEIAKSIEEILKEKSINQGYELEIVAVDCDHFHFLVRSKESYSQVGQMLLGYLSFRLGKLHPELKGNNCKSLWGGRQCKFINDEEHLKNVKTYIQKHKKV